MTTRTKYLIVKLLIAAGLTTAVIFALRYYLAKDAAQEINLALEKSVEQVRALNSAQSHLSGLHSSASSAMETPAFLATRHDADWAKRVAELLACEISVIEGGKVV